MPFEFERLEIKDVVLIKPKIFRDKRGFFLEAYKKLEFETFGIKDDFIQDNHSKSIKGVLRGLHYQKSPKAQAKLVRCIRGKIFDVAVDIRKNSPTFKKWVGVELSEENQYMLYIPIGFAHGFLTLSEEAEIMYKVAGSEYSPAHDAGIIYNDPDINIDWPKLDVDFILSHKDKSLPRLKDSKEEDIF